MDDTFDNLDLEKLTVLINILKDNEVPYFKFGILEVGMAQQEPEPVTGFVPAAQRAVTQAEKQEEDAPTDSKVPAHYRKAFKGLPMPTYKKG